MVIDRDSNDATRERIKEIFPEAIIKLTSARLGWARKLGAELVDTPLFAYLDDDVQIPGRWFELLTSHLTENVGAIHAYGAPVNPPPIIEKWDSWVKRRAREPKLPNSPMIDVTREDSNSVRGYTNNTIIRTALLKDWRPPTEVSAFEDWLLLKHITSKGYVWRIIPRYIVPHFRPGKMKEHYERARWSVAGARLTGFSDPDLKRYLKDLFLLPPQALLAAFEYRDVRVLTYIIKRSFAQLQGYLKWSESLDFNRISRVSS